MGAADLQRFLECASARAETIDRELSQKGLDARIRAACLFPDPDPLLDPFDLFKTRNISLEDVWLCLLIAFGFEHA